MGVIRINFKSFWRVAAIVAMAAALVVPSLAQEPPAGTPRSGKAQIREAGRMMSDMQGVLQRGFEALAEARRGEDVAQLNAVNEALSAIKGVVRLAEDSYRGLQEAVAQNKKRKAEHAFVKISIAHTKVLELEGQIRAAMGGAAGGAVDGKPSIDKVLDADLPNESPVDTIDLFDLPFDTDRPPSSSTVFTN